MALRRPRTERSYPTPITNFDDRNRESYIARSGGIGSIKPMGTIVDYNLGKGGRDPSMIGGFGLGVINKLYGSSGALLDFGSPIPSFLHSLFGILKIFHFACCFI